MLSGRNVLLSITIPLCLILFLQSQTIILAVEAKETNLAIDFCSQRRTSDDRTFCIKVLNNSPAAKDHSTLLKIATDAAHKNAKKTLDYMNTMFVSKVTNQTVKPVLKDCISMYEVAINEFEAIEQRLGGNSFLAKSDARIGLDEIKGCERLVDANKKKIPNSDSFSSSIANRNRIAVEFGELVVDLSKFV